MTNQHGDFIWYELMTNDADAAQQFYAAVLGWSFEDSGQKGMDYRIFTAKTEAIGGVMPLSPEMTDNGARPCWMGYICVDDVDSKAKAIVDAGGSLQMEPWDTPDVGRVAFIADPQGVMFYIMTPATPADCTNPKSNAFAATEPMVGHCAWNELATSDQDAAIGFYSDQFGWRQEEEMTMDEASQEKYKFLHQGDVMLGAVMKKPDEMPISAWSYYFRVPDIDAAVSTIEANNGQVLNGPHEIPGDEYMINGMDPQGAMFSLVGVRK